MIRQAYIDTLDYLKSTSKIIFGIFFIALVIAIPVVPTYLLVTAYFNNLFCIILGVITDFVLVVFIFNLLFAWSDSKKKRVD